MSPRSSIHWVLDFDGTITQHDTLDALVSIAASTKPSFPTQERWSQVKQAYLEDYTSTLSRLTPDGTMPSTIREEKALLHQLRAVEQRSLARVSASEIFTGLTWSQLHTGTHHAIAQEAAKIIPRTAFSSFYHQTTTTPDKISLLSVNWSSHFLRACLAAFLSSPHPTAAASTLTILSNDIDTLSPTTPHAPSSGHIIPRILSSADKLQHLTRLRNADAANRPVVYVGDSWTDIEALLAADLGICIRDEPMGGSQRQLAEALERLGVECARLGEGARESESESGGVVWVRGWEEIGVWRESGGFG
ncbi:hypothetical protein J1614_012026 [Plenodomus biglobosus]|nr:hypothetical protein J1614_012026 [Plenodomus biglobosus]